MTDYGYSVEIPEGYEEAVTRTRLALRSEGFSILTEAHVGDLLGPTNGGRQYLIMGAWNSSLTENLRDSKIQVGFHIPCNVVVHESGDAALVAALDPADTVEGADSSMRETVEAARGALHRVLQKVSSRD
jgi:uncharacterized protein (DUF302 family)